jgi:hypothetical protein
VAGFVTALYFFHFNHCSCSILKTSSLYRWT